MQFRDMGNYTRKWELQCTLAVYTAFKSESNAIEFTKGELDNMDAGFQALRSLSGHLASVEINVVFLLMAGSESVKILPGIALRDQ